MINLFQVFILSFSINVHDTGGYWSVLSGQELYLDRGSCAANGISVTKYYNGIFKKTFKNQKVTSEYTCLSLDLVPEGK